MDNSVESVDNSRNQALLINMHLRWKTDYVNKRAARPFNFPYFHAILRANSAAKHFVSLYYNIFYRYFKSPHFSAKNFRCTEGRKESVALNLRRTLLCGQCFRWREIAPDVFAGTAGGRRLVLTQQDLPKLEQNPFWRRYFDFDTDYETLRGQLAELHPNLREAARQSAGIHILRQDPWEALCSFILSQNNNIPRIQGIVSRLCQETEEPLPYAAFQESAAAHPFPRPETLAGLTEAQLAPLRCGFRARYLLDAAQKVADGTVPLEQLRTVPLAEARAALMQIVGVGPKVADCTLLYGLHRMEAFPVDVWMKRAMAQWFPGVEPAAFGAAAGLAQQYIFNWARNGVAAG